MRFEVRERMFLFLVVLLLLLLSGCVGSRIDKAEITKAVTEKIHMFRGAVEAYNVETMLGFLDQETFTLSIKEGGVTAPLKDYAKLREELEEDEEKQLRWRQAPPAGYGYVLRMELGEVIYAGNVTDMAAVGTVSFIITEQAEGIPGQVTDQGTIVCEMVKKGGHWLCQRMTIHFETPLSPAAYTSYGGLGVIRPSIGLGRLSFSDEL